ncbi:MAG: phosphoribosylamine--glycine ligase [Acidimicrobiia bacterium]|nr:phosphoribosylamine--glycine ligase [Acidimicrobiia bacterium]
MKILVIGSGAREHALAWTLARDPSVSEVVCSPGNAGIARTARMAGVTGSGPGAWLDLAVREAVDLTVVGPELPLGEGVADRFRAAGRPIVGPTRAAAALETSKAFAKAFMARHGVPTARFVVCTTADEAFTHVRDRTLGLPLVIKADGLAAGKGVVIAEDTATAEATVRQVMVEQRFGRAGDQVVLEECLQGPEVSCFVLCDGRTAMPIGSAQDHKRAFDGDQGPNTGGMGAFAPSPLMTPDLQRRVMESIVQPVLDGMVAEGRPFHGFLYAGLMLTADGPKVIEFNVRFGDPEAQVVLPALDEPLSDLLLAAAAGALPPRAARFQPAPHVGVVLASGGYPGEYATGLVVSGLDEAAAVPGAIVFHAGTTTRDGQVVTTGGRVLTVVGRGATFRDAAATAYDAAGRIRFDGMHYRQDIGRRVLA